MFINKKKLITYNVVIEWLLINYQIRHDWIRETIDNVKEKKIN